jgi:hypothetical protein
LIIDASGLNYQPVLLPRFFSPGGIEVYGPQAVSRPYVVEYGSAGYRKTRTDARSASRVGKFPIELKAIRTMDQPGHIVLTEEGADKIKHLAETTDIIHRGRIIIVTENTIERPFG